MNSNSGKILGLALITTAIGYAFIKGNQTADTKDKLDFRLAGLRLKNILSLSPSIDFDLEVQNASASEAQIEINDVNLILSGKKAINGDAQNKSAKIAPKSKSVIKDIKAALDLVQAGASIIQSFTSGNPIQGELEVIGSFNGIVFTQKFPFKHQQA